MLSSHAKGAWILCSAWKLSPASLGNYSSYQAGDYFQMLRNIIAPAAPVVRQQSSLIIMPEWEYSS